MNQLELEYENFEENLIKSYLNEKSRKCPVCEERVFYKNATLCLKCLKDYGKNPPEWVKALIKIERHNRYYSVITPSEVGLTINSFSDSGLDMDGDRDFDEDER